MERRRFVVAAPFMLAMAARAHAQRSGPPPRIGFLSAAPLSSIVERTDAFKAALHELGYTEGRTIVIEWRSAEDDWSRLPALAEELVKLKVDAIVTAEGPAAAAAKRAAGTIPIVMGQSGDPVATGLVANLAHPGGNITGLTTLSSELPGKQVELLKETLPQLSRLAILSNPANPANPTALRHAETAARAKKIAVRKYDANSAAQLPEAFAAMRRDRVDGLVVLPDPMFLTQRNQIAELVGGGRMPVIYGIPEHMEAGGLMAYAANRPDLFRRAASYVDKILRGARPGDLPIEQPTKFEFIISLPAARALGLTIPQSVLLRADRVIQ